MLTHPRRNTSLIAIWTVCLYVRMFVHVCVWVCVCVCIQAGTQGASLVLLALAARCAPDHPSFSGSPSSLDASSYLILSCSFPTPSLYVAPLSSLISRPSSLPPSLSPPLFPSFPCSLAPSPSPAQSPVFDPCLRCAIDHPSFCSFLLSFNHAM